MGIKNIAIFYYKCSLNKRYLAKLFGLSDYEIDLKTACFLDYYVTQYWWAAKQKQFNQDQVATYFTIAYLLMDNVKGILSDSLN